MSRKTVKLILFIFGAAVFLFWHVLFFSFMQQSLFNTEPLLQVTMLELLIAAIVALVPMSIAMLMHAKDIKHKHKGFAIFLTILSIFWLAGCALNATAVVIVSLIFGWDTYMYLF